MQHLLGNQEEHIEPAPVVGYVVSTWPRLSQTFVLTEVVALERRGVPLRIFSVKDPGGEPIHAKVAKVHAEVTYLSFRRSWKHIVRGNLRLVRESPGRYTKALMHAVSYGRMGVLRRFFQAGYLAYLLRREPVGHLHAHFATAPTLIAMFASELTGIPYTFTAHAKDIYIDTQHRLLRKEIEQARAVVTVSEYNRQYLRNQIAPSSNGKVHCIYNGIDLADFNFRWPRKGDPGPPVILSVARLIDKKGLDDLIKAAALLKQRGRIFTLEIIGSGPLRQALDARAAEFSLGDSVVFRGAQPQDEVFSAYQRATIFALPCIVTKEGDRDGIPTVVLEAMASGVPVVSTPISGIPELIDSCRDGVLVPPGNPSVLADVLNLLLTDPQLRDRLAQAARTKVESQFRVERSSNQLVSLFPNGAGR
jgi:glycosyltransferase involved in cell wall biosynthesis